MCYCYHDEESYEQDGHEDDDHQVVQSREGPLGHVVKTCPLFLFTWRRGMHGFGFSPSNALLLLSKPVFKGAS